MAGQIVNIIKANLVKYFENKIRPFIIEENKGNIDIFFNQIKKFHSGYNYIVRWYEDTLRISVRINGLGVMYFLTGTIEGKEPYDFGEDPSSNEG